MRWNRLTARETGASSSTKTGRGRAHARRGIRTASAPVTIAVDRRERGEREAETIGLSFARS
jgi:hypothetical protein